MSQPHAVILGAGPVGRAVARTLAQRGERVQIVSRRGVEGLPAPVESIRADITDLEEAKRLGEQATHVYNCVNPPYTAWPRDWPPLLAGVLACCEQRQAKLIVMSNLYVYGRTHGKPIHEDMLHAPHTRKGRLRESIDAQAMEQHVRGRHPVTILRASDFVGPGVVSMMVTTVWDRLAKGLRPQFLGNPDLLHTYTYIDDIGRALVALGDTDAADGREWLCPSPTTRRLERSLPMRARALGARRRCKSCPTGYWP